MITFAVMVRKLPVVGSLIAWRENWLWVRAHQSTPNGWERKEDWRDYR